MDGRFLAVAVLILGAMSQEDRIPYEGVKYKNHEEFVEEIREDLPVGTPEEVVLQYLRSRGIPFSHAKTRDYSVEPAKVEHYILLAVKRIRSRFIFGYTSLRIRVFLSDERCVTRIESDLVVTSW